MDILTCTRPGLLEYTERELLPPAADNVVLKVRNIGICGTDLHAFEGTQPYFSYPRILGHEIAAEIADPNGHTEFKMGETVTLLPYFSCGHCIACRKQVFNCCANIQVFGVHIDGGMQTYISVPASSLVKGEGLTLPQLALVEPLAIGAHAVRKAAVGADETVVVSGAGAIGLGIMALAQIGGAKVIAVDVNEHRLTFCREKLGIEHTIHAGHTDATEAVRAITRGDMADVVFDATGNLRAIEGGLQYVAHSGKYVLVGLQKQSFSFSHPEFHKRETILMSSRNALRADFAHVIENIQQQRLRPEQLITHTVSFKEAAGSFANWLEPGSGVIKPMIQFN